MILATPAAVTSLGALTAESTADRVLFGISAALAVAAITGGLWGILSKAGRPGWHALIPFYNLVEVMRIIDQPWWWVIGLGLPAAVGPFLPHEWQFSASVLSFFFWVIICSGVARAFDRSWLFGALMVPLSVFLVPVLGFGKSQYHGPRGPIRPPKPGSKPRKIGRLEAWARRREGGPQAGPENTPAARTRPTGPNPNRSKKRGKGRAR